MRFSPSSRVTVVWKRPWLFARKLWSFTNTSAFGIVLPCTEITEDVTVWLSWGVVTLRNIVEGVGGIVGWVEVPSTLFDFGTSEGEVATIWVAEGRVVSVSAVWVIVGGWEVGVRVTRVVWVFQGSFFVVGGSFWDTRTEMKKSVKTAKRERVSGTF